MKVTADVRAEVSVRVLKITRDGLGRKCVHLLVGDKTSIVYEDGMLNVHVTADMRHDS